MRDHDDAEPNRPTGSVNKQSRIKPSKKLAVLKLVRSCAQVGELEIACAVWPGSALATARMRAKDSGAQLEAEGYLVKTGNVHGSSSFALSVRGATFLRLQGIDCRDGVRLRASGHEFDRRRMTVQYLVHRSVQGRSAYHQCWLMAGNPPIRRQELTQICGLTPHGIVLMPRSGHGSVRTYSMDWIWVFRSRIQEPELERMLSVTSHLGSWINSLQLVKLDRVVVVCDAEHDWIIGALRQYLLTHRKPDGTPVNIALVRWQIDTSLIHHSCEIVDSEQLRRAGSRASATASQ